MICDLITNNLNEKVNLIKLEKNKLLDVTTEMKITIKIDDYIKSNKIFDTIQEMTSLCIKLNNDTLFELPVLNKNEFNVSSQLNELGENYIIISIFKKIEV